MYKNGDPKHILLTFATRRPYRTTPDLPEHAKYDRIRGCWIQEGSPLVRSSDGTMISSTKKADQETGEDQKGE